MDAVLRALAAHAFQVSIVVATAAGGTVLLRSAAPRIRLGYWRLVVLLCLVLPLAPARVVDVQRMPARVAPIQVEKAGPLPMPTESAPPFTYWIPWLIAAGMAARFAWLAVGLLRLRTLRAQGKHSALVEDLAVLQRAIAPHADVQWHDGIDQPVTFGARRPTILLPSRLRDMAIELQRAVLCHELLHARRRDWLAMVFEEFVRAVFWFHPAFWWAIARIQLCREETVDALAIEITASRQHYMRALLAFADAPSALPAPPFTRRRHLVVRIRQLSKEAFMSGRRAALAVAALFTVIAASTTAVVAAYPMRTAVRYSAATITPAAPPAQAQTTAQDPRRLISLDLSGADLRNVLRMFSEISGLEFLVDPSIRGTVDFVAKDVSWDDALVDILKQQHLAYAIDGHTVRVSRAAPAANATPQPGVAPPLQPQRIVGIARMPVQRVDADYPAEAAGTGITARVKVEFTIAPDGAVVEAKAAQWNLGIDHDISDPNYWANKPQQAFVEAAERAARQWRFDPNDAHSTASWWFAFSEKRPDAAPSPGRKVVRVGGVIKPPIKIRDVKPAYPEAARAAGVAGVVILEVTIGTDGSVADARVLRSIPMLDDAAVDAVRQWQFTPTLLDGEPVDVVMTLTVNFTGE